MLSAKAKILKSLGGCVCSGCGEPVDGVAQVEVDRHTSVTVCEECAEFLRDSVERFDEAVSRARAKITSVVPRF